MDPLDKLSIPTPATDHAEEPPAIGYGHVPGPSPAHGAHPGIARTQVRRDVFWNNVVREILMALAAAAANSSGRLNPGAAAAIASPSPIDDLFDGRMGVITTLGQRIPIADIIPVFSCSMSGCKTDRSLSSDVQCTVYRITTPTGESYTLPISQIIGVHSLSDALVDQLEGAAGMEEESESSRIPFGFSAYTSLAKSEREDEASEEENKL